MNNLGKTFNNLPPWARGIVFVGGIAIVGLFSIKIYKKLFPSEQAKKNKELQKEIDVEISNWIKKGQKASFSDANYLTFANTIYEGMRYGIGDNYGKVVDTMLLMNNNLDVAKLIKAFGVRQNYLFGIDTGSPLDLLTFVQSELGSEYLGLTSYRITKINNDWAKKGITYKI